MEKNLKKKGFPGGSVVKNPPANVGDVGLIPDCMWEDSTYRGAAKPRRHNSAIQWLRLHSSNAGGTVSIPG